LMLLLVGVNQQEELGNSDKPSSPRKFADPAVPVLNTLSDMVAPMSGPNPDVRFHTKPKPLASGAITNDWISFLGPNHNAVSSETKLLTKWPESGPSLVWEMTKGKGYSSPAVQGERLILFHRLGKEEVVECLNAETGNRYWKFTYPTQFEDRYGYNNGPRASPVIDGDRVYTYGAEGTLHCLRLQTGQVFWKRALRTEFRVPQDFFGVASTPLIEGDLLIINIGAPGGPCVAGFDKRTGRLVWGSGDAWGPSYASPVPAVVQGHKRIFVFAGGDSQPPMGGLMSIDPATGALDFSFPWRSRSYESVNASCPVVVANQVFVSASYKTGGALLNILPDGTHQVAWTASDFGLHWNTPIHKDGYLYGFDGRNEPDVSLACIELKTGKVVWRKVPEWEEWTDMNGRTSQASFSTFRGSLLWVDGRFLCLGELGHLLWLDLTPQGYKELARARLFLARETWGLPVLSRGLLYVMQNAQGMLHREPPRLLCYDLRALR
jgi:outer membrane protein assembly factor BamB